MQDPVRHAQHVLQDQPHLHGPDPLAGVHERGGLVSDAHQDLLRLQVRRGRVAPPDVPLQHVPGEYGLQGPVGAAPAAVVQPVGAVVVVIVQTGHGLQEGVAGGGGREGQVGGRQVQGREGVHAVREEVGRGGGEEEGGAEALPQGGEGEGTDEGVG